MTASDPAAKREGDGVGALDMIFIMPPLAQSLHCFDGLIPQSLHYFDGLTPICLRLFDWEDA